MPPGIQHHIINLLGKKISSDGGNDLDNYAVLALDEVSINEALEYDTVLLSLVKNIQTQRSCTVNVCTECLLHFFFFCTQLTSPRSCEPRGLVVKFVQSPVGRQGPSSLTVCVRR